MTKITSLQEHPRSVGGITLASGLLALLSYSLLFAAIKGNWAILAQPALLFEYLTPEQATYFRWSMVTDIWEYYLLLVPAMVLLYEKMNTAWRKIYVLAGVAYVLFGSLGAAILGAAGTNCLRAFEATTDVVVRQSTQSDFLLLYSVVNDGIWNLLVMSLFGLFCVEAAQVLKPESRPLYYFTLVLATACFMCSIGNTFEWRTLAEIVLNICLILGPI